MPIALLSELIKNLAATKVALLVGKDVGAKVFSTDADYEAASGKVKDLKKMEKHLTLYWDERNKLSWH